MRIAESEMATAPDIDAPANPLDRFRAEAREWIAANFPPALKGKDNAMSRDRGPAREFARRSRLAAGDGRQGLGRADLAARLWRRRPELGRGRVLQEEMAARRRLEPDRRHGRDDVRPDPAGIWHRGTEARAYPGDRQGWLRWCQGYSGAGRGIGSRLASRPSPRTMATIMWSTVRRPGPAAAQWADKCFMLVRTDKTKKHEGITFLLVDMDTPGVEVKPIRLISGSSPFCETFFTDVKVPKANLVWPGGRGLDDRQAAAPARALQPVGRGIGAGRMFAGASLGADREEICRGGCRGADRGRGSARPDRPARDGSAQPSC